MNDSTWTWMSGSNTPGAGSNFGTVNVSSPTNVPGCRCCMYKFYVNDDELWLFGGGNGGTHIILGNFQVRSVN